MRRSSLALAMVCVFAIATAVLAQDRGRIRSTNTSYRRGDWITYSAALYVTSIAIGNDYVYFGTTGGITRYDYWKDSWTYPFTVSDGLADDLVTAVAFDRSTGYLWAATEAAISYYQPAEHVWYNQYKEDYGISPRDDIQSIGIANSFIILETQGRKDVEIDKYSGNPIVGNNMGEGPGDSIQWFGARQPRPQRFPIYFMKPGYIFDPSGYIEDNMLRRSRLTAYVDDGQGRAWIGTWGFGAGRIDLNTDRLDMLPFGLLSPDVRALAFDGDDLWIAGFRSPVSPSRHGVTRWNTRRQEWHYYESPFISQLRSDQVNAIAVDDGWVWLGTDAGLAGYHTKEDRWITLDVFRGLSRNEIFDVRADSDYVWVGSTSGLDRLTKSSVSTDSLQIEHILPGELRNVSVYSIALMENLVWAGTDLGIFIYDQTKALGGYEDEPNGPGSQPVTAIYRFGEQIWVGTSNGINVYDVGTQQWLGVPQKRFYDTAPVNAFAADTSVVWVATQQGALKYNRSEKYWRLYTIYDGLADNRAQAVLMDGDYVWFGTPGGLTRFYWNDPSRAD